MHLTSLRYLVFLALVAQGCAQVDETAGAWDGQIDTLSTGQLVVQNGERGIWREDEEWRVIEELRIGSVDAEGPEVFGDIRALVVDDLERIWVLDGQAAELRIFDANGDHVRTAGGSGSGPGEYTQPLHAGLSRGSIWVTDPGNARVTVLDSAGGRVEEFRVPGGMVTMPWPGGFDREGFYYAPIYRFQPEFEMMLGRFDRNLAPLDTLTPPSARVPREEFTVTIDGRVHDQPVPFQGVLAWRLSPRGRFWGLITDQYRLFELDDQGDTLRAVTKAYEPVMVSPEERAQALENLQDFVELGGPIDRSRIPDHKPPVDGFFIDESDHVWVRRTGPSGPGDTFDVFNATGEFMGAVRTPFTLSLHPHPIVKADRFYGVIHDDLGVEYVVVARIHR